MEKWMREIGIVMNISEFGVKGSDISICYDSFFCLFTFFIEKGRTFAVRPFFVIFANTHNTVM